MVDIRKVIETISSEAPFLDTSFYYMTVTRSLPDIVTIPNDVYVFEHLFKDDDFIIADFIKQYHVIDTDGYLWIPVTFKSSFAHPITMVKETFPDEGFAKLMNDYIKLYELKQTKIALPDLISMMIVMPETLKVIVHNVSEVTEFFTGYSITEKRIERWINISAGAGGQMVAEILLNLLIN